MDTPYCSIWKSRCAFTFSIDTLAEFTDTFRYRLEDAQHKGTGNECTVTITVKHSR
jgi:hypothetical protein